MKEDIYNLLKKDIQNKIGKEILYGKDCVHLCNLIYRDTRRQISSSTIKRFFGLIKSRFSPSKYTLETLVLFLGFKDWNDYLNCYDESKYNLPFGNTWDFLKSRIQLVSKESLVSLKLKTHYAPSKALERTFARKKFNAFEKSEKIATLIVAPEGYGKSTLLIQLVEKYFMNENARYKNDILALIDGGIFFNLYARNSNIELLNQLLEFKISSSLGNFLRNNPEQRKGRVWMIIDNVDEIYYDQESYHRLVENIMRMIMANDNRWFKLILTCRPENLDIFSYLVQKNPILQNNWFGVNFRDENMDQLTNVPLFSKMELETVMHNYGFVHNYDYFNLYHREVLNLISNPYLLSLFVKEYKQNEKISLVILLSRFIKQRLYAAPFRQEKIQLIHAFTELTHLGKKSGSVNKEQLLSRANYLSAYRQLISIGIFYEYHLPNTIAGNNTYVVFYRKTVFEYILFEKWRKNEKLTTDLFFKMRDFYHDKKQLQFKLLKLFVLILIHEEEFQTIKQLHDRFEELHQDVGIKKFSFCLTAIKEVVKNTLESNEMIRKKLAPILCRSKLSTLLYANELNGTE